MPICVDGWQPTWEECLGLARAASDHYSLTEREQALLYEIAMTLPPNPLIVELGVCNGKTAVVLAYVAKALHGTYIGIDNWSLEGTLDSVSAVFRRTIDQIPQPDCHIVLLQGSTHTVALPTEPIDLLLVDAGHDEANVSVDCARWVPLVRAGGYAVFDDYPGEHNWWMSPHEAVKKHADWATEDWDLIAFYSKIMFKQKPRRAEAE